MNVERINQCIEMMERAENLNMCSFQSGDNGLVGTVEELHTCGNTACFAGYLAVSPEFKAAGGERDGSMPSFGLGEDDEPLLGEEAVAAYLEISLHLASSIVYGGKDEDGVPLYPVAFNKVEPKHVIDVLNRILAGELE